MNRVTLKPRQFSKLLEKTIPNHIPIMVSSAPGIGKTQICQQVAKKLDHKLITIWLSTADPTDAAGLPTIIDGKAQFVPFKHLVEIMDASKPTVVLLDDIGQSPQSVQAAFMNLINDRKVSNRKISKHITFLAATNRRQDKAAVNGVIEPLKSRFHTIVEMRPSVNDFVRWGVTNDLSPTLLAFCRYTDQDKLFNFDPTYDMTNSPSPRTIHHLSDLIKLNLPDDIKLSAYSGAVGQQLADSYIAFEEIVKDLPDFRPVLFDPTNATLPDNPAILYAMLSQVVRHVDADNFKNVKIYADRLTNNACDEFATYLMTDIFNKYDYLIETETAMDWRMEHRHVIFDV
jgi:hypothetical protein